MESEQKGNLGPGEIKLPLDFPKCRVCGSTRLVIASLMDEEKAKGLVGKEARAALQTVQCILMDAQRVVLAPRVVNACLDICAECGAIRCVHAEFIKARVQMNPGMQGGKLPFFKG